MRRHHRLSAGLVLAAILLAAIPAAAARYHVRVGGLQTSGPSTAGDWDPGNCYATLAAAALAAAPADSVLLYPENHACAEVVTLPAFLGNRDLVGAPAPAQVDCTGAGRLVLDAPAPQAELRGVAFTGDTLLPAAGLTVGNPGGSPFTVALDGCEFRGFNAQGTSVAGGAAVRAEGNPGAIALGFDDCVFTDNATEGPGGAVFAADGVDLVFTACEFTGNGSTGEEARGGALAVRSTAASTNLTLDGCTFTANSSAGPGGAVSVDNASVHLLGCRVEGSRSGVDDLNDWSGGAGILVHRSLGAAGEVVFEAADCTFHDNTGSMLPGPDNGDGGAVLVKGRQDHYVEVTVTRCDFTANYNAQGAGLYAGRFARGSVSYCRFLDNAAWFQGGGAMKGGALWNNYGELVEFDYCEFVGNQAGYTPAGVPTGGYSRGGGLLVRNRPRATIRFCTFVDNRVNDSVYAVGDGFCHALEGSSWSPNNQCVLLDSVFWGEGGLDIQVRSEGGGIAESARLALAPGQFNAPGAVQVDFVWLTTYPLVSLEDRTPAAGSPLIDQGLDQGFTVALGGVSVPQGAAPDLGAYERPAGPSTVPGPAVPAALLAAHPNPFNPRTSIAATVPRAGDYHLVVHDVRGRAVARLHAGPLDTGDRVWAWDGRDEAGRNLPSGVYLARLAGPGTVVTCKLVLAR